MRRSREFGIRDGAGRIRLRRRHGARAERHQDRGAARLGRALHRTRRRRDRRHGEDRLAVGSGNHAQRRRHAAPDDAQHRHRRRRAPVRAADSGHRGGRLSHLRHRVEPAPAAAAAGGAGRRPDRLRTHPDLCPPRRQGHAGRNGAAHPDARRPGSVRAGDAALSRRRHRRAGRSPGEAVPDRKRREDPHRRTRRPGRAHRLRRPAGRRRPRGQSEGLRPGGTGHSGRAAPSKPTNSCKPTSPTSMPPATSPGRTSSPTPRRTRPGTRR